MSTGLSCKCFFNGAYALDTYLFSTLFSVCSYVHFLSLLLFNSIPDFSAACFLCSLLLWCSFSVSILLAYWYIQSIPCISSPLFPIFSFLSLCFSFSFLFFSYLTFFSLILFFFLYSSFLFCIVFHRKMSFFLVPCFPALTQL